MTSSARIFELGFRAKFKKSANSVSTCLWILPKNWRIGGGGGGGGISVRVWVKTASSAPACFTGPARSMMVLWNVCFLSIESSHFSPVRLNNYIGNIYFSEVFHADRSFLNQSDCKTFQTSVLKKQLSYIKHGPRHYCVTRHYRVIQCFCLFMVSHVHLCIDQSESNILEYPITQ